VGVCAQCFLAGGGRGGGSGVSCGLCAAFGSCGGCGVSAWCVFGSGVGVGRAGGSVFGGFILYGSVDLLVFWVVLVLIAFVCFFFSCGGFVVS